MKKCLLLAALFVTSMAATFAQVPDASKWKEGDEITTLIGWGNLSFENEPMDYWTFETTGGNTSQTGGLFECFNGADEDLYQYVQLPAGIYRMECQAYYRFGTSWDADPKAFGTADWQDNALLYVQNGTYDIDSEEFVADRTFKTPLMPRLFDFQDTQIFEDTDYTLNGNGDKVFTAGWDMSDGNYGDKGWGPCSVPGSLAWFQAGKYQPYDKDGVKYNTVTFFLVKDGYVRVGVSKKEPKENDSFMATNFKMYYMGEVDPETAELMALQDEVAEYYHKVEDLEDSFDDGGLIYTLINDGRLDFDGDFGSIDKISKEEIENALATIKKLYEDAVAAQGVVGYLANAVKMMEILYSSTDYAGKADFGAALKAAQDCLDPNYEIQPTDDFGIFQKAYDNLLAARIAYLMTQTPVDGTYNFSSVINTPFFCNNEYTPVWNAEAGAYQFPTLKDVEEDLQPENTWATVQETSYSDLVDATKDTYREGWIPICGDVTILEKEVENQWVIHSTTWHGGALGVTLQHSYPAIGGWTAEPTGNPELLYQTVTGLPNGYYAMSALMCNAGAEISELQYAYIETADARETAPLTVKGNPWWGGNRDEWRAGVWEKLTTNMVQVTDGKVTVGVSSDAFYAATGFQLYYYGETPDFTALLAPMKAEAEKAMEDLTWPGDVEAAGALFGKIPAKVDSREGYLAALDAIAAVKKYVATATTVINNWKGVENFSGLASKYDDGSDENELVTVAMLYTLGIGQEDTNDSYLAAIENDKDYAAYVDYLDYRSSMGDLLKQEAVAAVVAEQNAFLKAEFANAAKMAELKAALAAPYNQALLASLGMDKASEEAPVDVTALIVNPRFDELNKGWDGSMTVDSLGTVECYNTNFNVSQTIYALPAGCYQVVAQAFYRDGSAAKDAYNAWWYTAAGDMEFWENGHVKLYANVGEQTVVSIASELPADQSHTEYVSSWKVADEADENGNEVWEPVWVYQKDAEEGKENDYPWDTKVEDLDEVYYYPNSLRGAARRFAKSPEAYLNKVATMVEEGGSLTIGIKKDVTIANDWCSFDNFKLYYLGTKAPVAIETVNAAAQGTVEYYSISGARLAGAQKGVNIVRTADGQVRKVYVK